MKRCLWFPLLCLAGLLLLTAAAAEVEGDWEYESYSSGSRRYAKHDSARITGYKPQSDIPETLVVPDTLGGYPVRQINHLSDVYPLPEGYTGTARGPRVLVLPSGLKTLDVLSITFSDLEAVQIENSSVYTAVDGVLFGDEGKTLILYPNGRKDASYTVPEGTKYIRSYAFHMNEFRHSSLSELILPDSLVRISKNGICAHLPSLHIPEYVTTIEGGAIRFVRGFTSSSKRFQVTDNMLIDAETQTLIAVPWVTTRFNEPRTAVLTVPEGVKAIANNTFDYHYDYKAVILPSTLQRIGSNNWIDTTEHLVLPDGLTDIGESFTITIPKGGTLILPQSLRSIDKYCSISGSLRVLVFTGDGVSIEWSSFDNMENLEWVVFPRVTGAIGRKGYENNPFTHCPKLTAMVYPGSDAEKYCKQNGIKTVPVWQGRWRVDDPAEAAALLSMPPDTEVFMTFEEDRIILDFTADGRTMHEEYACEWSTNDVSLAEGYMPYTAGYTQMTLDMNGGTLHLTRVGLP